MKARDVASKVIEGAGKSALGMVAKAVIEIEDERITKIREEAHEQASSSLLGTAGNLTESISAAASRGVSDAINNLLEQTSDLTATKKQFTVRFNPSQLTLQAQGGGRVAKTNFATGSNENSAVGTMEYGEMAPRIQLEVELIFDDSSIADSFMEEKLRVGGLIRTGIDVKRKKTHTVQRQVEGFIAALRNSYTRKVTFFWGSMCYSGILNHLDATYTMFSISGHPVRASVRLGILCVDSEVSESSMGQWKNHYEDAFSKSDSSDLESVTQNVGNLLNINL